MSLWRYDLVKSSRLGPMTRGATLTEAVMWLAHRDFAVPFTSICPIYKSVCETFNDMLPFRERQKLKGYIPELIGTNMPADMHARFEFLVREVMTVYLPFIIECWDKPAWRRHLAHADGFKEWHDAVRELMGEARTVESTFYHHTVMGETLGPCCVAAQNVVAWSQVDDALWAIYFTMSISTVIAIACELPKHRRRAALARLYAMCFDTMERMLAIGAKGQGLDAFEARMAEEDFATERRRLGFNA